MTTTEDRPVYMHCVCLLMKKPPEVAQLEKALCPLGELTKLPDLPGFCLSGEDVEEQLGEGCALHIDIVDHPWDDDIGFAHPESLPFWSWAMGEYGLYTCLPRALLHAVEQGFHFPDAARVAKAHGAYLRVRVAVELSAPPARPPVGASGEALRAYREEIAQDLDDRFEPQDRFVQLFAASSIVESALYDLPGALAWFVPGGERLGDREFLEELLSRRAVSLVVQTRQVAVGDGKVVIDTCGGMQLGLRDLESIVPEDWKLRDDLENFHLNVLDYMLQQNDSVIADGDTIPGGPGGRWVARFAESTFAPPRGVIQLALLSE